MLNDIPTHLIAGPLGAGKTSLIRSLLAQRPVGERWAVLINEFGRIGLDAALLETGVEGVTLSEVAGGCLCCVNGAPFRVGLGRLLRQARPDRLLIEPSGLGHPLALQHQLGEPPWRGVLALQPSVMVLDAAALACGQTLPDTQQQALGTAGLLVLNKSEQLDAAARQALTTRLPALPRYWTCQGALPLAELPGLAQRACSGEAFHALPRGPAAVPAVWSDPARPICQYQGNSEGWSIGWRWHPGQRFDVARLQAWLAGLSWRRAKLIVHGEQAWLSGNALEGAAIAFRPSEWRRDSRLELIFAEAQDVETLSEGLAGCRIESA